MKSKQTISIMKTIKNIPKLKPRAPKSSNILGSWELQTPQNIQVNQSKEKLLLFYKTSVTLLDLSNSKTISINVKSQAGIFYSQLNAPEGIVLASGSSILIFSIGLELQRRMQRSDTTHQVKKFIVAQKRGLFACVSSHCIQIFNNSLNQLKCLSPKSLIKCAEFTQNHQLVVFESNGFVNTYALMGLEILSSVNVKTTKVCRWLFLKLDDYLIVSGDEEGIIVGNSQHKFKRYEFKNQKVEKFKKNTLLLFESHALSLVNIEKDNISVQKILEDENISNFYILNNESVLLVKNNSIVIRKIDLKQLHRNQRQQTNQSDQFMNRQNLIKKLKDNLHHQSNQINRQIIHPLILEIPYDIHRFKLLLGRSYHSMNEIKTKAVLESLKVLFEIDPKIQYSKKASLQSVFTCLDTIYRDPIKVLEVFLSFVSMNDGVFDPQIRGQVIQRIIQSHPALKKQKHLQQIIPLVQFMIPKMVNLLTDIFSRLIWLRFWDFMVSNVNNWKHQYLIYLIGLLVSLSKQTTHKLNKQNILTHLYQSKPNNHLEAEQFTLKYSLKTPPFDRDIYSTNLKYLWMQYQVQDELIEEENKLNMLSERLEKRLKQSLIPESLNCSQWEIEGNSNNVSFYNNVIEEKLKGRIQ